MGKFEEVYAINVNEKVEQKDGLSYLSWAWAWAEFKKVYPNATYSVDKFDGTYCTGNENLGYMVRTEVFADELVYEMWLPVLDGANNPMKNEAYSYKVKNKNFKYAKKSKEDGKYYDNYGNEQTEFIEKTVNAISMFDVNKAIMRCLTKNLAMFGLGLYIYAGEDLPEGDKIEEDPHQEKPIKTPKTEPKTSKKPKAFEPLTKVELVKVWGVATPEKTIAWLEGQLGKELANFTEEETAWARQQLEIGKKKKAARQSNLEKIDGEVPFPMGE